MVISATGIEDIVTQSTDDKVSILGDAVQRGKYRLNRPDRAIIETDLVDHRRSGCGLVQVSRDGDAVVGASDAQAQIKEQPLDHNVRGLNPFTKYQYVAILVRKPGPVIVDCVLTVAWVEQIGVAARIPVKVVVPDTARYGVVTSATTENVIARKTEHKFVRIGPANDIIAKRANRGGQSDHRQE